MAQTILCSRWRNKQKRLTEKKRKTKEKQKKNNNNKKEKIAEREGIAAKIRKKYKTIQLDKNESWMLQSPSKLHYDHMYVAGIINMGHVAS